MSAKEAGRGQAASGSRPDEEVRSFYRNYHDAIQDKRLDSPYPLRRYVHRAIQETTLESVREFVKPGARILDAGCGEGSLVLTMADAFSQDNVSVTGVDLSEPRPQRNRRRQEDVSKGEPSCGQTGLHSRSSDLTSELQSSVRFGRSCNSNGATPDAHRASPSSERGKAFVSKGMPSFAGWSDSTAR